MGTRPGLARAPIASMFDAVSSSRTGSEVRPAPAAAPRRVRRRDGTLAWFDGARIEAAVARAAREAGHRDPVLAAWVAARAGSGLAEVFGRRPPGVEDV